GRDCYPLRSSGGGAVYARRLHRRLILDWAIRITACTAIPRQRSTVNGVAPSSALLDQLHLHAVGRGNPAYMPTVVDALFEDLRTVLLKAREGAGVIVG